MTWSAVRLSRSLLPVDECRSRPRRGRASAETDPGRSLPRPRGLQPGNSGPRATPRQPGRLQSTGGSDCGRDGGRFSGGRCFWRESHQEVSGRDRGGFEMAAQHAPADTRGGGYLRDRYVVLVDSGSEGVAERGGGLTLFVEPVRSVGLEAHQRVVPHLGWGTRIGRDRPS